MNSDERAEIPGRGLLFLGLGFLLLLAAAWYCSPSSSPEALATRKDTTLIWHCPNCNLEVVCPPGGEKLQRKCPHCVHEGVLFEVRAHSPSGGVTPIKPPGRATLLVALGIPAVLALAVFVAGRVKARGQAHPTVESTHTYTCPECRHKLKYRPSQRGQRTTCPTCSTPLAFPDSADHEVFSDWQKDVAEWQEEVRQVRKLRRR